MPTNKEDKAMLSIKGWIAVAVTLAGLAGSAYGGLSLLFASKGDVHAVQAEQRVYKADDKLRDWRLRTVEVKVENLDLGQRRVDENVVRLMTRLNVEPVPAPAYQPLPAPPVPPDDAGTE